LEERVEGLTVQLANCMLDLRTETVLEMLVDDSESDEDEQ
jgi:hypothetical protein